MGSKISVMSLDCETSSGLLHEPERLVSPIVTEIVDLRKLDFDNLESLACPEETYTKALAEIVAFQHYLPFWG